MQIKVKGVSSAKILTRILCKVEGYEIKQKPVEFKFRFRLGEVGLSKN